MVNNCGNLNIILTLCTPTNTPCRFMADPHSCPNYPDEDFGKILPFHPSSIDRINETVEKAMADIKPETSDEESLVEFTGRLDREMAEINVKPEIEDSGKPNRNCLVCGANEWWLRKGGQGKHEWLCGICHPEPIKDDVPDWF